ncbi:MAG: hypothetical protein KIS96_03610 [Bauldia sp.]|nr:hypothetical protein [Bauldia sp.]
MTYYRRDIVAPATRRDGLANFVQIIINQIEDGDTANALLTAVDLHNDIESGIYDNAMADAAGFHRQAEALAAKHAAEIAQERQIARAEGVLSERRRLAALLGLDDAL